MSSLLIVSGASTGIGLHLAAAAAADGCTVATLSRRHIPGRHLACDLSDAGDLARAGKWMTEIVTEVPEPERIMFVHNAGAIEPIGFAGATDLRAYQENLILNAVAGPLLGASFLSAWDSLPPTSLMTGACVMISSGASRTPYPGWSAYCAGKAALDHWVRTVGEERAALSSSMIVSAIAPGVVDTPMQAAIRSSNPSDFPQHNRFVGLHTSGTLLPAEQVGQKLWTAVRSIDDASQGARLDLADITLPD